MVRPDGYLSLLSEKKDGNLSCFVSGILYKFNVQASNWVVMSSMSKELAQLVHKGRSLARISLIEGLAQSQAWIDLS